MMPNVSRGADVRRLMWYLAGPGRFNEHTNQRVLAGDVVTMAVYAGRIDERRAWELGRLIDSPRQTLLKGEPVRVTSYKKAHGLMGEGMDRAQAFETATSDENTWHCSLALRPEEGQLSDQQWRSIADDFMTEMELVSRSDGVPNVRWVAVNHGLNRGGGDHIHIAASVVRPDGSLADLQYDWPRSQEACQVLERRHGLEVLASREFDGTEQATKPAERARMQRLGAPETDREALQRRVRALAASADSEAGWLRELRDQQIVARPFFAPGGEEVTGYSVRMPAQRDDNGNWEKALWYSGTRLGKDLTLTALRGWAPWDHSAEARDGALEEWRHWERSSHRGRPRHVDPAARQDVIAQLGRWSAHMRTIPYTDRDSWEKAASQSAGLFAALSMQTETAPGPLDRMSRQLARAGTNRPAHRKPGNPHEAAARGLARMVWASASPQSSNIALVHAVTDSLLAVRDMHAACDRAHSATALASNARRALTEIHMRADGLDPSRPYEADKGSPAWAAAVRAGAVVDGHDSAPVETVIQSAAVARTAATQRTAALRPGVRDPRPQPWAELRQQRHSTSEAPTSAPAQATPPRKRPPKQPSAAPPSSPPRQPGRNRGLGR